MSTSIRIDNDSKRICSRAIGNLTFEELFFHMRDEVDTDTASYPEIFDCTSAMMCLDASDFRMLAENCKTIAESQTPGTVATVAKPDLYLGVFRKFNGLTKDVRPLGVFSTCSTAERCLDSLENPEPAAA